MMDCSGDDDTYHPDDPKNGIIKPPKKKGRPSMQLRLDESGMGLDVSYKISDGGTFSKEGFSINRDGMITPGDGQMRDDTKQNSQFQVRPEDLYEMGNLGKGAGGIVKKMLHIPTTRLIALKSINVTEKSTRHQLISELGVFAGDESPYSVSFFGAFFENGHTKLALEYLNRGSLQDVLDKYGPCKEEVLASIAKQSLLGLKHLHSHHKVHRDIKPANILVDLKGNVKIADFGILAELANTQAKRNTFIGTQTYMSPERIQSQEYSYPSDVWSLGLTLMTCALGKLPLEIDRGYWGLVEQIGEKPLPSLPAEMFSMSCRSFIASCLQKDPARRARVKELLMHPFVSKVDPAKPVAWPFDNFGGEQEEADLDVIIKVVIDRLYPNGMADYKQSIFELARFQWLSTQLGLYPKAIQKKFEDELERRG